MLARDHRAPRTSRRCPAKQARVQRAMGTEPVYATRRMIKDALDVRETARADAQIDRALASASRAVDGLCQRVFYPTLATRTFDWPNEQRAPAWRLWLDADELAGPPTMVTSGGSTVSLAGVFSRPDHGPPFTHLECNRSSVGGWTAGATPQRSIGVSGPFGYEIRESAAGALSGGITVSSPTIPVTDASVVGAGSVLRVGAERLVCTGSAPSSTGLTVAGGGLAAAMSGVTLTCSGVGIIAGEVLLLGGERVLAVDVAGAVVTVRRAYDGSVLSAHSPGAPVNAWRSLTVERGALGTTAAAANSADVVHRFVFPGPVVNLTVAYALAEMGLEQAGMRETSTRGGGGQVTAGMDLSSLADRVYQSYARKARRRAV